MNVELTAAIASDPMGERLIAACAVVSLGGCSWLFMDHLPDAESRQPGPLPPCSMSQVAPSFDMIGAGAALVDVALFASLDVSGDAHDARNGAIAAEAVIALMHIASGVTGFKWAQECDEARDGRIVGVPVAPVATPDDELAAEERARSAAIRRQIRFCTASASDPQVSACTSDRDGCDAAAAALAETAPDIAPCAPTVSASCYRTLGRDGAKAEHCFTTVNACITHHDADAGSDDVVKITDCRSAH